MKYLLPFLILIFSIPLYAQNGEWVRSHNSDNLELYYRYQKSGSDTIEFEMKASNDREKDVLIVVWIGARSNKKNSLSEQKQTAFIVKAGTVAYPLKMKIKGDTGGVSLSCWSETDAKKQCPRPVLSRPGVIIN